MSESGRRRVQAAFGHGGDDDLRIADTSHLLVNADLPLAAGGSKPISFYDPVRLVQHVIDHSPALNKVYGETLQARTVP